MNIKKLLTNFIIQNKVISYLWSISYKILYKKKRNRYLDKKRKILIAQTIFVKNEKFLELNIQSIKSLWKYLKNYETNIDYVLWFSWRTYDDRAWGKIEEAIHKEFGNHKTKIIRYKENIWKATYINNLVKEIDRKNDSITDIFTFDSDILFSLDCPYLLDRIINATQFCEKTKKQSYWIMGLSFNGTNNHHTNSISQNRNFFGNNISWVSIAESIMYWYLCLWIAGSCRMINKKLWDEVGGYKYIWKYWPDDAIFLAECVKKWYSWQVMDSVFICHNNINYDKNYVREKVNMNKKYIK